MKNLTELRKFDANKGFAEALGLEKKCMEVLSDAKLNSVLDVTEIVTFTDKQNKLDWSFLFVNGRLFEGGYVCSNAKYEGHNTQQVYNQVKNNSL